MKWNEKCLLELTHHNMFETTDHRNRFRDLIDCYYTAPYFTKNLCKCMYLACWSQARFDEMLTILNELTIEGNRTTYTMAEQYRQLILQSNDSDREAYKLIVSFLTNSEYDLPNFALMDPDDAHMIRQSLMASKYIDDLSEIKEGDNSFNGNIYY